MSASVCVVRRLSSIDPGCDMNGFAGIVLAAVFVLAGRGKEPTVEIGVPEGASPSVAYAASELRDHILKMTGTELSVVTGEAAVVIREISDERLGSDGFRLRCRDGRLTIEGGRRGVLYGVYELLETYGGCGWFSSRTTVVPERDVFAVPAELATEQKPAFRTRELLWFDTCHPDFGARLRLNGNYHRPKARHGGNEFRFGGGLGNCHTFAKLLPVDEYFDSHPEYFSEAGGRRFREHTQLCLTNPDVLRIVTEKVLAAIARDPEATFFGVSQNDWQGFCTCAKCKAVDDEEGSHAGTMIRFVNAIAEEVAKKHPGKIIETLAYQYTRKPPLKVRPRDNVMVCLCTIECDFSVPIADGTGKANAAFRKDIAEWSKLTDKLYLWDYTTNFKCYIQPFPNLNVLQPNLEFFRDHGVVSILEQGAYQGAHADFAELKAWMLAKLMWNPRQSTDALVEKFTDAYYGKAAPLVRRYLTEIHELQARRSEKGGRLSIFEPNGSSVCDADFLDGAVRLWRDAEKAVAGDAEKSYNVRMSALPTMYLLFMNRCREFSVSGRAKGGSAGGVRPQALAKWLKDTFAMSKSRIRFSESYGNSVLHEKIRRALEGNGVADAEGRLVIPMDRLRLKKLVDVPGSISGKVFAPPNSAYDWYIPLQIGDVSYDGASRYRIRLRIKVDRADGDVDGEAFWAGVYDNAASAGRVQTAKKVSECPDGWHWYDVGELELKDSFCLWLGSGRFDRKAFGRNPALKAVYFDAVEISRVGGKD